MRVLLLLCSLLLPLTLAKHSRRMRSNASEERFYQNSEFVPRKECGEPMPNEILRPCPTPKKGNAVDWPCVRYADLCNGIQDCPGGEDESAIHCLFHSLHNSELNAMRSVVQRGVASGTSSHRLKL